MKNSNEEICSLLNYQRFIFYLENFVQVTAAF
jgi:hypothetical protein